MSTRLRVEICRHSGVVVDVASRARQAVEVTDHETADAVQRQRLFEHGIDL